MTPSIIAQQLEAGLTAFLKATFPVSSRTMSGIVDRLCDEGQITKGPFLSIDLPFRHGTGLAAPFQHLTAGFTPHLHQERAWQRLHQDTPQSTLVATGTGSGKTEAFLYPILDYCRTHKDQRGIKAILIYPMNALATDQAKRIAGLINENAGLKGVRAGLYIGRGKDEKTDAGFSVMGPDHIITNRDSMQDRPPDILLTNYKMLDYLLIRPRDQKLWRANGPDTLRFLVIDELHTFDGAQGTDVACLLRRVKRRLKTPKGHLCAIGTSATLGAGAGATRLLGFAEEVFGESFTEESVITEDRVDPVEFLASTGDESLIALVPDDPIALSPAEGEDSATYAIRQATLWLGDDAPAAGPDWTIQLGEQLKRLRVFRKLLRTMDRGRMAMEDIMDDIRLRVPEWVDADDGVIEQGLVSLLALISTARSDGGGRARPFLNVRCRLWVRELRRMVASISPEKSTLQFSDDLVGEDLKRHTPMIHCRECHVAGWGATQVSGQAQIETSKQHFYDAFFGRGRTVRFLFPRDDHPDWNGKDGTIKKLCTTCLELPDRNRCACDTDDAHMEVIIFENAQQKDGELSSTNDCPFCRARRSLMIVGSQAASLTSTLIGQLFASPHNVEEKLLAFSDSVQDAAHRAGFFSARTYRFAIRTAIQKVAMDHDGATLPELTERFHAYWRQALNPDEYAGTFAAPDMEWLVGFQNLIAEDSIGASEDLLELVDGRVRWEIAAEYGIRSRIGRSLEKAGSSIAHVDPARLDGLVAGLLEIIQNEVGGLRDLQSGLLRQWMEGLLLRLRHQGGILVQDLETFIQDGKTFPLTKRKNLPNFGPRNAPSFLTRGGPRSFDPLYSKKGVRRTWLERWTLKSIGAGFPITEEQVPDIVEPTLTALVEAGVLVESGSQYGLNPDALLISLDVIGIRCEDCGHGMSTSGAFSETWVGAPCLRTHCGGHYEPDPDRSDYAHYRDLYASGKVRRLVAREHTGLLDREPREELEKAFMGNESRHAWNPNLLSATSTLEMGIDIGDLSSVFLCSVPPSTASYLQRIGRAGRKTGNAFTATVANGRPHDLYFYEEPSEMIAGAVTPPAVYLNASAVLERQLMAYCLDRWVEKGLDAGAVPKDIKTAISALASGDANRFPLNLTGFIARHEDTLFDEFINLFDDVLTEASVDYLRTTFYGDQEGSLVFKLMSEVETKRDEIRALESRIRGDETKLKRLTESNAQDEETRQQVEDLTQEVRGLRKLIAKLRQKRIFEWLSESGLLPNYAFPEAGVLLRSVIYQRRDNTQDATWVYEYQRAAAAALSELAPSNRFYARGRRVQIDQVDLSVSDFESWRLCAECPHMELKAKAEDQPHCPRCGSVSWGDVGQEATMLKMRQVIAREEDRRSRIGDESDTRRPQFFQKQLFVDVRPEDISVAYQTPETVVDQFGFEFLRRATFREVNFGLPEGGDGWGMADGAKITARGFLICEECGKVGGAKTDNPAEKYRHHPSCKHYRDSDKGRFSKCVFMYRDFESEGLRILVPGGQPDESFIAAFHLGLKEKFGSVDHLGTTLQRVRRPGSTTPTTYLVLYDQVPGGTGYLKQLMQDEHGVMEVLDLAKSRMDACTCQRDPAKDGCYRCLFAYRVSRKLGVISRSDATKTISRILQSREAMERRDAIVARSDAGSESVLEDKFVEVLREMPSVSVVKDVLTNGTGYRLTVGDRRYTMQRQVDFGDDTALRTRADLVITYQGEVRKKSTDDEQEVVAEHPNANKGAIVETRLPIAIYLDGYAFHRDTVAADSAKRASLIQSGRYLVWSLSWDDVIESGRNLWKNYYPDHSGLEGSFHLAASYKKMGSLELLIELLSGDPAIWKEQAAKMMTVMTLGDDPDSSAFATATRQVLPDGWAREVCGQDVGEPDWLAGSVADHHTGVLRLGSRRDSREKVNEKRLGHVYTWLHLDEVRWRDLEEKEAKAIWSGYWRMVNLLQFNKNFFATTREGVQDALYDPIPRMGKEAERNDAWSEAFDLAFPEEIPVLEVAHGAGWEVPVVGRGVLDKFGRVVGRAELSWEEQGLHIVPDDDLDAVGKVLPGRLIPKSEAVEHPTTILDK